MTERLQWSYGKQQLSDQQTILQMLPNCVTVLKTTEMLDRRGVDYIARLSGGAEVLIDAKNRDKGCSRFWINGEPELALERYSVMPGGKYKTPKDREKIGWTLNTRSPVHYIFFKFDATDTDDVYLLPFQLLRKAFRDNGIRWFEICESAIQDNGRWESKAVFVPVGKVTDAIRRAQIGFQRNPDQAQLIQP